jgi:membrane protein DedA with SNARE-associated domain
METLLDFLLNFYGPTPYILVFGLLLACGLGLPLPEDITLIVGGVLAYYGVCDIWPMMVVCFLGVMVGDAIMFTLGAKYGRPLMKKAFFQKILPEDRLKLASDKFKSKSGNRVLFAARFMPGLRAPMFFSAGLLHVPFSRFLIWDGLAAFLSVPAIVGAVYYFGDEIDRVMRTIQRAEHGILGVIIGIALVAFIKYKRSKKSSS